MSPSLIWFLIGVGFILAELVAPGFILVFFCLGSWVASLAALLFSGMDISLQIAVFLFFSLLSLFTLRKVFLHAFRGKSSGAPEGGLAESLVGLPAEVTGRIGSHAPGEIKFRGSFWRAVSDQDIEVGARVVIERPVSEDGLTYKVKRIEGGGESE